MKKSLEDKIIIGLTGGAGSGKSSVADYIVNKYDAEFIHCDEIAHELMAPGGATYGPLLKEYGKEILDDNGREISRQKLTEAVKNSAGGFERLNMITHPLVIEEVIKRMEDSVHSLILVEAALLIESGIDKLCDEVWFIYAFREERIGRIKASRDWSEDKIQAIINNQLSDEEFIAGSDLVLENHNGSESWKKEADDRIMLLDSLR
ncbi:MAG: dephospho-CoA kinase [Lachnospiraceae bacterium]|nr:dephospho-CoA kinase [Lachnospiraceae bacterium]